MVKWRSDQRPCSKSRTFSQLRSRFDSQSHSQRPVFFHSAGSALSTQAKFQRADLTILAVGAAMCMYS